MTQRWGSPVIVEARRNYGPECVPACGIPPGTQVLVTGATGFTGSLLTRKLVNAGLKVRAIARESSDLTKLNDLDIEWIRGDVFDKDVVERATEGVEYIFHLAAAFREAKSTYDDYCNVHELSTELLAAAVLGKPQFKRFIHVSTIGVHGHIEGVPATEEHPFNPGDHYQETKAKAELWIRDYARDNGLPLTVIRPAAIYGPGDRRLLKFFKMASSRLFFLLGQGKCSYHLIHVDDLTNAIILSATKPEALGEVFIVGDDEPIPLADMVRITASVQGQKVLIARLPVWPFFLAADICQAICRPFGIEPPIYRRRVAFFTKDRMFDCRKRREVLGYKILHPSVEGVRETAQWYIDYGWMKGRSGNGSPPGLEYCPRRRGQ